MVSRFLKCRTVVSSFAVFCFKILLGLCVHIEINYVESKSPRPSNGLYLQMAMANGLAYGGGLPMGAGVGAIPAAIPFHPNQMINMNAAMYLYPRHLIAQPLYTPQQFATQQQMVGTT